MMYGISLLMAKYWFTPLMTSHYDNTSNTVIGTLAVDSHGWDVTLGTARRCLSGLLPVRLSVTSLTCIMVRLSLLRVNKLHKSSNSGDGYACYASNCTFSCSVCDVERYKQQDVKVI